MRKRVGHRQFFVVPTSNCTGDALSRFVSLLCCVVAFRVTGWLVLAVPGLPSHAGYAIACEEMSGGLFGAMLSFRVVGGQAAAVAVAAKVKLIRRATSLGGTETTIQHCKSLEGMCSRDFTCRGSLPLFVLTLV